MHKGFLKRKMKKETQQQRSHLTTSRITQSLSTVLIGRKEGDEELETNECGWCVKKACNS